MRPGGYESTRSFNVSTPVGFEPTRSLNTGLAGQHLNRSVKESCSIHRFFLN